MARARPGLEKAINEILERQGVNGRRLSYRQAERLTGLSTATISELAKGNARTAESLRRFAHPFNEDATRLMLLAGFVPDEEFPLNGQQPPANVPVETLSESAKENVNTLTPLNAEERACLLRLEHALTHMPPGHDRALWKDHLAHSAEVLERFVERGLRV